MLKISSKALTLTCFTIMLVNIDVFYVMTCHSSENDKYSVSLP